MQDTVFFVHMTDTHINIPGKIHYLKSMLLKRRVMFLPSWKSWSGSLILL